MMIDETYIEFVPDVDELSAIPLTELFDNVIILRGTSKFFAISGTSSGLCHHIKFTNSYRHKHKQKSVDD